VRQITAAACGLLSSAKDAFHEDDISRLQIPSLETFNDQQEPELTTEATELTLAPDDDTSSDVIKPNSDQNEDSSLEDIEAKVSSLFRLQHNDWILLRTSV